MIRIAPELIEPHTWFVAFHRTSPYWWVRLLAAGHYKHVSAFSYLPELRLWLVYDVTFAGTRLVLLPDGENATRRLAELTLDADIVECRRVADRRGLRLPFSCVSAIAHLLGIPGYPLRPDGLFRILIRDGRLIAEHNGALP